MSGQATQRKPSNYQYRSNDNRALVPVPQDLPSSVRDRWTDDEISTLINTVAYGIQPHELPLFASVCDSTGLNPFLKQIYAIPRAGKLTIQTSIDGLRLLATRSKRYAGSDEAEYIEAANDGDNFAHPAIAKVTVYRLTGGMRCAFVGVARWSEYVQRDRDGNVTSMWRRMPYTMLAKCAESQALRKAFPAETSGIYTSDEMMQADNDAALYQAPRKSAPARTTVTQHTPAIAAPESQEDAEDVIYYNVNDMEDEAAGETPEPVEAADVVEHAPAETSPASSAPRNWSVAGDRKFRQALNTLGVITMDAVEQFAKEAAAEYPGMALYEACKHYYAKKHNEQVRAAKAQAGIADSLEGLEVGTKGN